MTEFLHKIDEKHLQLLVKKLLKNIRGWQGAYQGGGDWRFSKTIKDGIKVKVFRDSSSDDICTGYQPGLGYRIDMYYRNGKPYMTSNWMSSTYEHDEPISELYYKLVEQEKYNNEEREKKLQKKNKLANQELGDLLDSM